MIHQPLSVRLVGLVFISLIVAGQINRGIYRLAWNARDIGPWSKPPHGAPPRRWYDRIPVLGWFGVEREGDIHGKWFWIRPMILELSFVLGMCALYMFETGGGLHPAAKLDAALVAEIHWEFLSHYILISLMVVATFIDIDEKTIPDAITVPGTLMGLTLATVVWPSLLPVGGEQLWASQPHPWPAWLHGPRGWVIGWASYTGWCVALLPRTVWFRSGFTKGVKFLVASSIRHQASKFVGLLWLAGTVLIFGVWRIGGNPWQGLLTSLVGIAAGGSLVWAIRIAASSALGKEALGFGDVTLMAMIGSYLGWQTSILVFFLAPFAGVVIAVAQFIFSRQPEIAFGPFLCAAALLVIVRWPAVWGHFGPIFQLGWLIPGILIGCILLMALMLVGWRWITGYR